jgi:hypothetical protein
MEGTETVVGEINCVNCGRTLAEAIADTESNAVRMRPAPHQMVLQVEVINGRRLRCKRCHGRAFFERLLPRDVVLEQFASRDLVGAA